MWHRIPQDTSLVFPRMGMGPPRESSALSKNSFPGGESQAPTPPRGPARAAPGCGAPSGARGLPVGLMHAASFPPPPPPPAGLTRICARPLLPPLREPETEASAAAAPGSRSPRACSPSPGSGAAGCGVVGRTAARPRAPRRRPRSRHLSSRARGGGGGAERGRWRGRSGGARRPRGKGPHAGGEWEGAPPSSPRPMGSRRACTCRGAKCGRPLTHTRAGPIAPSLAPACGPRLG